MKLIFASLLFAATTSVAVAAPVASPSRTSLLQSFISSTASVFPMPESKGRTGSKRIGGYSSKGKGSSYVGGRK
ncbi:MAG: hypothetical protein Q7U85_11485 [Rhodocyclaceae bacterium]|nr:hypothetical protein [Rhodocyclaceae bacterium]